MPNYQNSQISIAALFCLVLWSAPAVAQRADSEQPLNLIGDSAQSERVTVAPEANEQLLEANVDGDQTIAIDLRKYNCACCRQQPCQPSWKCPGK